MEQVKKAFSKIFFPLMLFMAFVLFFFCMMATVPFPYLVKTNTLFLLIYVSIILYLLFLLFRHLTSKLQKKTFARQAVSYPALIVLK
nr:MAG TPA: hypothetical protein [Caudoviricetes sp.]